MPSPTIVFDLDGTLVDTAPDLIDTLNVILARHDVAPVAFDEARTMIGAGVKPLLQRGLASKGVQLPPKDIDRLYAEYLEVYAAHIADGSKPFPGLERALDFGSGARPAAELGADRLISHFDALPAAVTALVSARA